MESDYYLATRGPGGGVGGPGGDFGGPGGGFLLVAVVACHYFYYH